jgi:8-oxo-dGTP pyrophosphatase MutT (NUDIX family)
VAAGEDTRDSALRELGEEMGIFDVPIKFLFDFKYQDDATKVSCVNLHIRCCFCRDSG